MLDKIEIYPYQRISETPENTKPRRKRILRTPTLKIPDLSRQHVINFLRLLLNWPNLVLVFTSLFLARASILGELFPFVFAFVASFAYEKKLPALLLVVAGTAGFASCLEGFYLWQNLSALIVLAIIIHTVTVPGRITKWALPLLTASILIVTKSIALLFWQINLYQEMIIIFESILTAMLTFVFLICNKVFVEKKALEEFTFEEITALVILCTGLLLGVNNVYILNFSISSILCRWAILSAAFLWGSGAGTMMGVMAGIIPSLASSIFSQALAMYAIAGLLAGLFRLIGRIGSIIGFMLAVLAFSFFSVSNEPALIYIQESIISSTLFFFSINYFKGKLPFIKFTTANALESSSALPIEKHYQEYTQNQIHHLAQVFDELSASFVGQATSTPGYASEGYLNFLYESIASQLCKKCPRYEACWQRDCYNTSQELLNLFTLAEKQTQLSYNDCPPSLKKKCIFAEELLSMINHLFDNLRLHEYWQNKLGASRQLLSTQLKEVGEVVKELATKIKIDTQVDYKLREKLLKKSRLQGLKIHDIIPLYNGNSNLTLKIKCPACSSGQYCERKILPFISSWAGYNLELSNKVCSPNENNLCEFTLCETKNYTVYSGAAQVACNGICGDSFVITELNNGKFISVISDGMGTGEKACQESQTAITLLESLLNSGFDNQVALKTINSVLMLRSDQESFTTMDMLLIDLFTGQGEIIKTAAAPSFVKRGPQIEMICSSSLPVGILQEMDAFRQNITLTTDDMVIMVSDGVIEATRNKSATNWLPNLLRGIIEDDCQRLAEYILSQAVNLSQGKPKDDMTVICLRIAYR